MTIETIPTLASVLTPFPYHIDCKASLSEAKQLMEQHQIRHLVVLSDGDIYSLISDREIQHHAALYGSDKYSDLKVNDVCATSAVLADIHDRLDKVLEAMAKQHLGSVVILRDGELAGIFTTTDACRHFAKFLRQECPDTTIPDIVA
jgi:acetoin utilization protein AcuB